VGIQYRHLRRPQPYILHPSLRRLTSSGTRPYIEQNHTIHLGISIRLRAKGRPPLSEQLPLPLLQHGSIWDNLPEPDGVSTLFLHHASACSLYFHYQAFRSQIPCIIWQPRPHANWSAERNPLRHCWSVTTALRLFGPESRPNRAMDRENKVSSFRPGRPIIRLYRRTGRVACGAAPTARSTTMDLVRRVVVEGHAILGTAMVFSTAKLA
jgi:hypothetical protein